MAIVAGIVAALLVVLALMATATPGTRADSQALEQKPNVIFIVTDDQRRRGTLSVMPKTVRWFVRGGTNFNNAFATTPLCCPARSSIFSGRYAHNHGVHLNDGPGRLDLRYTVQSYLDQAGYRTALFGSKFLNYWPETDAPPSFDVWATTGGGYQPFVVNEQGVMRYVRDGYSTDYLADRAVEFIQQQESDDARPWFLYVAPKAPHLPATPAPRHANAAVRTFVAHGSYFEQDRSDKPPFVRDFAADPQQTQDERTAQLRSLMAVDELVDRLLSKIREAGEDSRTLTIYLSDNGNLWGEHGLRFKEWPYRESVQIPLMVRWPGRVAAGAVDRRLVANIDLAATAVHAAGLSPQIPMDGISLLDASAVRQRILAEGWARPGASMQTWASTISTSDQYIEYYGADGSTSFREYYNRASDFWQLTNMLGDGDPANDPPLGERSAQLGRDRICQGRGELAPIYPPCP
jgi:arylsulfatase A-like enzyme